MATQTLTHVDPTALAIAMDSQEAKQARVDAVVENWQRVHAVPTYRTHGRTTTINTASLDWQTTKARLDRTVASLSVALNGNGIDNRPGSNDYGRTAREIGADCVVLAYSLAEAFDTLYPEDNAA